MAFFTLTTYILRIWMQRNSFTSYQTADGHPQGCCGCQYKHILSLKAITLPIVTNTKVYYLRRICIPNLLLAEWSSKPSCSLKRSSCVPVITSPKLQPLLRALRTFRHYSLVFSHVPQMFLLLHFIKLPLHWPPTVLHTTTTIQEL